jgi:DNA-binding MarR family transcriptional regulator
MTGTSNDIAFSALLRAARAGYGGAIRAALDKAGYDDIPKNGIFVIGAINRTGAPLANIIAALGVSKQAAGQLVDALVLRGYLERDVDAEDRRRLTVKLSERGRAAANIARAAGERVEAALVKRVGREYVAHTRATLMALIAQTRKEEDA